MKEIMIKIPDETLNVLMEHEWNDKKIATEKALKTLEDAFFDGEVLPKGHKELIDTKELIQDFVKAEENMKDNGVTPVFDVHEIINMILSQEVIIEADKEYE